MRRVAAIVGLSALVSLGSGCFLYFGDSNNDDDNPPVPVRDAGPMTPDAVVADANLPPCEYPDYSSDCSQVDYFECGFEAHCEEGSVVANWHEHVFCEGYPEQIVEYSCSYDCADGCTDGRAIWPENGDALVAGWCVASGAGSSCSGNCGMAVDGCYCDEACVGFGDCCDDYEAQCTGCPTLEEDACQADATCQPVYTGINCTDPQGNTCTGGESNCTCESFEFAGCEDKA